MKTQIEKLVLQHCAKSEFLHTPCERLVNAIHSVASDPELAETMGLLEDGKYVTGKVIKTPGYSYMWNINWGTDPIKDTTLGWQEALDHTDHPTKPNWAFGKGMVTLQVGNVLFLRRYGSGYLPKVLIYYASTYVEIPEGSHIRPFYRYWNRIVSEVFGTPLEHSKAKVNREFKQCRAKIGDLTSSFYKLMADSDVEAYRQQLRSCVSYCNGTLKLESGNLRLSITEDSFTIKRCISLNPLKWVTVNQESPEQFTRAIAYSVISMLEEQNILRKY